MGVLTVLVISAAYEIYQKNVKLCIEQNCWYSTRGYYVMVTSDTKHYPSTKTRHIKILDVLTVFPFDDFEALHNQCDGVLLRA